MAVLLLAQAIGFARTLLRRASGVRKVPSLTVCFVLAGRPALQGNGWRRTGLVRGPQLPVGLKLLQQKAERALPEAVAYPSAAVCYGSPLRNAAPGVGMKHLRSIILGDARKEGKGVIHKD